MTRTDTSALRLVGERAALLIVGVLALTVLVRLHGIEKRHDDKKAKIYDASALTASGTWASGLLSAAAAGVTNEFPDRDALYLAIDRKVAVPDPEHYAEKGSDLHLRELARLVVTNRHLTDEEESLIPQVKSRLKTPAVKTADQTAEEAQLLRVITWRQRFSKLYLMRAEALENYEGYVHSEVRREFDAAAPIALKVPDDRGFAAQLGDHHHPLHVIYDLLWYAALATAVLCLAGFLIAGVLRLTGVPGLDGTVGEKAKKLIEVGDAGGGRAAGALATMATITLVGAGTIASSVGSMSSSPWKHTSFIAGDMLGGSSGSGLHSGAGSGDSTTPPRGLTGAAGDKGAAGDAGADGKPGEVIHRVTIDPISLNPQQITIKPEPVQIPQIPIKLEVNQPVAVPEDWPIRLDRAEATVRTIDPTIHATMDPPLADMTRKVDASNEARRLENLIALENGTTIDGRGAWAALPWFRQFRVGAMQVLLADRAIAAEKISRADSDVVRAALVTMAPCDPASQTDNTCTEATIKVGDRYQYHEFIDQFRHAVEKASPGRDSRYVSGVLKRNLEPVLGLCRVPR
jgi:hypothetical protein